MVGEGEDREDRHDRPVDLMGLVQCDSDLTISEVNLTACRLLSRRREELVGQPLGLFVESQGPNLEVVTRRLRVRGLEMAVVDAHLFDRFGGRRPIQVTLASLPVRSEDAPRWPHGLRGASFLVGLEPRRGHTLHAEARRWTADGVADRARDLILRYRLWPEAGFEYVSASSEDLLGYPPSAFYGDPALLHRLLVEPAEAAELNAVYDGLWEPRHPITLHVRHRDGRVLLLELRPTVILDGERRVIAVESISRDVTRLQEEQLEYKTVLGIRHLIDLAVSGSLPTPDPVELLQVGVDAMCTYLGWPVGVAFMGDAEACVVSPVAGHVGDPERFGPFSAALEPPDWSSWAASAQSVGPHGEVRVGPVVAGPGAEGRDDAAPAGLTHRITVPVPATDGIGALVELFTEDAHPPEAAVIAALGTVAVEIGRMFAFSQTTLSFRRMDELRQEFVERAAHELRAPVASIALMASVLADQAADTDPHRLASSLEALASQADRVRVVATHLLSLSQLEEGRVELHLEAVSVRAVASSAASSLVPEHAARAQVDIATDLKVMADAVLLDEVLANLLVNACRHGGPRVIIGAAAAGDEVTITVSDDGPGLPPDVVAGLFQPIPQRLVTPEKGGLGLSLVHQMMVTMGGEVAYEPSESGGARFLLRLPRA